MRTEEQRNERHLRNLRRRFEFLQDTVKPENFGAVGELAALRWALKLLATDPRIQVTDVQRTSGIVAQLESDHVRTA